MTQLLVLTVSVGLPTVALVIVAWSYFAYLRRKAEVGGEHAEAYRSLVEQVDARNTEVSARLEAIENRTREIEKLLRSVE